MARGIITETGRRKLARSHAGEISLPPIAQMGFGSGGVVNGAVIDVTGLETRLKTELLKKDIGSRSLVAGSIATMRYVSKLDYSELPGTVISEVGLFDTEGDLVAYKTFLPKSKDEDMEFIFSIEVVF